MNELIRTLVSEFKEKDYAHAYMVDNSNMRIAAQVRALRLQRDWSQDELATRSGMAQTRISKIESADFNSLTLKTLRALAKAFDVHLMTTFTPFSTAIMDFVALSPKWLECAEREADLSSFESYMCTGSISIDSTKITNGTYDVSSVDVPVVQEQSRMVISTSPWPLEISTPGMGISWATDAEVYFQSSLDIEAIE